MEHLEAHMGHLEDHMGYQEVLWGQLVADLGLI